MTAYASICGQYMCAGFPQCLNIVVTTFTTASGLAVIDGEYGGPCEGGVTGVTKITGGYMTAAFCPGDCAIVTIEAGTINLGVGNGDDGWPGSRTMAGRAGITGCNMSGGFCVAAFTRPTDLVMVDGNNIVPVDGAMTGTTLGCCSDVACRFSTCPSVVVTATARPDHFCVINDEHR